MSDVPGTSHFSAEGHQAVALRNDFIPRFARIEPSFDRHGRIHQAWKNDIGSNAVSGITSRKLLRECDDRRLGGFVAN